MLIAGTGGEAGLPDDRATAGTGGDGGLSYCACRYVDSAALRAGCVPLLPDASLPAEAQTAEGTGEPFVRDEATLEVLPL